MHRGKPLNAKKYGNSFIYGAVIKFNDQRFIFPEKGGVLSKDQTEDHWNAFGFIEVHPDSVGRFLGFDGISEGDIARAEYECSFGEHIVTGLICYESSSAAWFLEADSISIPLMQFVPGSIEILGTFLENPELLED